MRPLSATTVALLDELYQLADERSWFPRGRARAGSIKSLLQKIASTHEPLAIPRIISLTFDSRREVAEAAGQSVKALLRLVNVRDLSVFDRAFRDLSPWTHPESARWREMRPADLRAIAGLSSGPTLLQLAMCHPSGYVREEAIRRSATCADGSELSFLLLRTNDWVKPVRDLAQVALRARLTVEQVADLVNALPMLDAMNRWRRLGSTTIIDEIDQLLRDPRSIAGLITASKSADRFARRAAYRRLFERDRLELPPADQGGGEEHGPYRTPTTSARSNQEIFAAALRDRDPAIRAWAGHWLTAGDNEVFASFADQLLRDRLGAVRVAAARRLIAAGAEIPWPDLLLDPFAAVRVLAQKAALDAGEDPDAEYRDRITSCQGARLGVALVGSSETGGPSDMELVRHHLRSQRPVVRRSALHALANFKADDLIDVALAALLDESPTVSRAARDLLVARSTSVRGVDVWSAFTRAPSSPGKRATLAVLASLGFWESLPYLLRAFDASDEVLRPRVLQYLVTWLGHQTRIFVSPSPSLVSEVSALLRASRLPEGMRRDVDGVLDARVRASSAIGSPARDA